MTKEKLQKILESAYNRQEWIEVIHQVFGAQRVFKELPTIPLPENQTVAKEAFELANMETNDDRIIGFYEVQVDDSVFLERNRVSLRNVLRNIYKYDVDGAVIAFVQKDKWRLSFVSEIRELDIHGRVVNKETDPKRYTYLLGQEEQCRTATDRLFFVSSRRKNLKDFTEAFSVDQLTKEFYTELSNWYHRAVQEVEFPGYSQPKEGETKKAYEEYLHAHKAQNVIRLITRLIFIWFLKQRIPALDALFDFNILARLNLADSSNSTYYKAILQNLFFATLNTRMNSDKSNSRRWVKEGSQNNDEYLDQRYYRYKRFFKNPEEGLQLFENIPFLNGGLFDNLDYRDKETGETVRIDCFSTSIKNEKLLRVPDRLFWNSEVLDLSEEYNSKKKAEVEVAGIINILKRYNFTLEENTPLDKEVALDPELLGKVFENLLASYNPETQTPARNQTGSFYTPREVVNFMVDESLKAYLLSQLTGEEVNSYVEFGKSQAELFGNQSRKGQLIMQEEFGHDLEKTKDFTERLNYLFNYNETDNPFNQNETRILIEALDNVKIIDPANGTGAYPMGALLRMVELLKKLDPDNKEWHSRQWRKLEEIPDPDLRTELEDDLKRVFKNNHDYGRKLYLIENCLYGVDLQPIACQISKLRFFISLIVDQKIDRTQRNFGIRPLPNLETKFVAADTLMPLEEGKLIPDDVYPLKKELKKVRDAYFVAKSRKTKRKRKKEDEFIREKISALLKDGGFPPAAADQIAKWNPYDQNKASDWFNSDWMFGVGNNFNIVLGNPPYIQLQKDKGRLAKKYAEVAYSTFSRTGDIYSLFYERGMQLLKQGGVLSYITSNKWMKAGYGKATRNFFWKRTNPLLIVDFDNVPIFETATVDTVTLLLQNSRPKKSTMACKFDERYQAGVSFTDYIAKESYPIKSFTDKEWVIMDPQTQALKDRLEEKGIPLSNNQVWKVRMNYGIKTGLNTAFIISEEKKAHLEEADSSCKNLFKPILSGKNIQKWQAEHPKQWLIALLPSLHYEIDNFPSIKNYFIEEFGKERLEQSGTQGARKKTSNKWFETQDSIAYWRDFEKKKIIWGNLNLRPRFAIDTRGTYVNAPANLLSAISNTVSIEYLLAVLNSAIADFYIRQTGYSREHNYYEYKKVFVEKIPVIPAKKEVTQIFEVLVNCIVSAKAADTESSKGSNFNMSVRTFEQVIDGLLFDLYFEEEMKEKDISIFKAVEEEILQALDKRPPEELAEDEYLQLSTHLTKTWTNPSDEVRNKMMLFATRSPEVLRPILELA